MVTAVPNETFDATLINAPTGLVGEITFSMVRQNDGQVVVAPSTADIFEVAPTVYRREVQAPVDVGDYTLVWAYMQRSAIEELSVNYPVPVVTHYATLDDLKAYAPELQTETDETLAREIVKAERDIDWFAGFGGVPNGTSGLRFDPLTDLEVFQAGAITRATCAQVQYRLYMGPSFLLDEMQYRDISGPNQNSSGAQRVGPQARAEFPTELRKLTGRFA